MDYELMYYVVTKESFVAEDRYFYKGEKYPVYNKNNNSLLVAENGEFYFTNELMNQAIVDWELEIINKL